MIISDHPLCVSLDYIGSAVFAATGAVAAIRKQMDLLGCVVLAIVTAIGGGTLRDMLIGQPGVFWIHQPRYIWISALTGCMAFACGHFISWKRNVLLVPDAVGLALFTWIGCEKTCLLGLSNTTIVIMGVLTGAARGIIRDILSDEVPSVLIKGELYATASMMGGLIFLAATRFGLSDAWRAQLCICATLALRMAAIRWKIALPTSRVIFSGRINL